MPLFERKFKSHLWPVLTGIQHPSRESQRYYKNFFSTLLLGFDKKVLIPDFDEKELWKGFSSDLLLMIDNARDEVANDVNYIKRRMDDPEIVCLGTGAALPSKYRNGNIPDCVCFFVIYFAFISLSRSLLNVSDWEFYLYSKLRQHPLGLR
jgi:hypothetical protein